MVDSCQWFTHSFLLALKFLTCYVHRSTLPQSALAGCQLPQGGSRDWLCHSSNRPETATLRAIFIAPTETQMWVHFSIQRTTLPQSALAGVPAPSEREPEKGTTIAWVAILRTIPELCRRGGFQGGKSPPLKSDKKVSITLDNGKNPWYTVRRLRKKAGIVYA